MHPYLSDAIDLPRTTKKNYGNNDKEDTTQNTSAAAGCSTCIEHEMTHPTIYDNDEPGLGRLKRKVAIIGVETVVSVAPLRFNMQKKELMS